MATKSDFDFPDHLIHSPAMTMPLRGVMCHESYCVGSERISAEAERTARRIAQESYERAINDLNSVILPVCESPIEQLMAVSLKGVVSKEGFDSDFVQCPIYNWEPPNPSLEDWARWKCIRTGAQHGVFVFMQAPVWSYRVDFLLAGMSSPTRFVHWLVVECDGHQFHAKTKEQVSRDRSRDRFLTERGYHSMRFTGSEIWADPWKCAEQAVAFLLDKVNEDFIEPAERGA